MTTLSVDIETHSDFDFETGAYRYVEAPDFEILIIAYSIDGQPVQSIDMYDIDEQLYKKLEVYYSTLRSQNTLSMLRSNVQH